MYELAEMTDEETVRVYPEGAPFVLRDQSLRNADDTTRVVIGDVLDVLQTMAEQEDGDAYRDAAKKAEFLYSEACALWDEDETDYGWLEDPEDSEALRDILQQAENLPHVSVDWNGDAGTATVTISDLWQEISEEEARAAGVDTEYL